MLHMGGFVAMAHMAAMPASLRCLLFQSLFRPGPSIGLSLRALHSSTRPSRGKQPGPKAPPGMTPPDLSLSYIPPPSNLPNSSTAIAAEPPSLASLDAANAIFLRRPPRFLSSAPRFVDVPINSHMPEVCLLGRSNVGKSTLINALAGVSSAAAGRTHGAAATRAGLAITSARAGSTLTMNAYGFGRPMRIEPRKSASDAGTEGQGQGQQRRPLEQYGGVATRAQRRGPSKFPEYRPDHSLVLMDMPGYGLHSRTEWGVEIGKYLARRERLRGAVVLIDVVAGVKDGDRMALAMLRNRAVRTAVVLTKADKVVSAGPVAEAEQVKRRCAEVWEELRGLEEVGIAWSEGNGWEKEVWVTGAGDPTGVSLGVAGVRFAIAAMAGLLEDRRGPQGLRLVEHAKMGTGRVVPFDEIKWTVPQESGGLGGASF